MYELGVGKDSFLWEIRGVKHGINLANLLLLLAYNMHLIQRSRRLQ